MLTSLKIALRFLKSSKIQTLIIILGIAIGVSVQIFIGLLSKGLETSLEMKVVGSLVHVSIYPYKGQIENWEQKRDKINSMGIGTNIVAPEAVYAGFINSNNTKESVQVRGYLSKDFTNLYDMKSKIYEGKMIDASRQVLVGKELKNRLGIKLNDKLDVITYDGKKTEYTVVGFYDFGAIKIDSVWLITDLKTAQDASGKGDQISAMEISLKDAYSADLAASKIQKGLGDSNLKVENWKDQNKVLVSGILGQKVCTAIIEFFVLLAAVLSIISILGISVVQKYKQIGILKAMGMGNFFSGIIFLLEALILGILGTALGILFTFMYIKGFNRHIIGSDGKPLVDIIINRRFIMISSIIDIGASTLAAVFPALKSFTLSPVEVIKNG